jgi:hypothetical protein
MSAMKHLNNIELTGFLKILNSAGYLDMDKNEVRNAVIQNLGTEPVSPSAGQIIYNTVKNLFGYWNGTAWVYPSIGSNFGDTNSVDLQHNGSTNTVTADVRVVSGGGIEVVTNGLQLTSTGVSAGEYTKVTIDVKGRVTSASNLLSGDLPSHTHASHTDILDFDTGVRQNLLNEMGLANNSVNLNNKKIINLAEPTNPSDGATKNYVDSSLVGLRWKVAARVATTGNITLSGTQTIDGVAVVAGDRVLVKAQTTGSQNGIYIVASGAWTRPEDANIISELVSAAIYINEGTANGGSAWTCTNNASAILGTTAITWSIFAGTQVVTASLGLEKVNSDIRVKFDTNPGLELNTNSLRAKVDTTKAIERIASGLAVKVDNSSVVFNGSGQLALHSTYQTRKFVGTITGNGALKIFAVTHNFGTTDVAVEVYEVTTNDTVILGVTRNSTNQVTVEFAIAPINTKQYKVVVIG